LHGRVQHHFVQAAPLDHACALGGLDGLRQQPLAARFAGALVPAAPPAEQSWSLRLWLAFGPSQPLLDLRGFNIHSAQTLQSPPSALARTINVHAGCRGFSGSIEKAIAKNI